MNEEPSEQPTEFHKAVVQILYQYMAQVEGAERLAALAKGQVVGGYAMRRLLQRSHMLNKPLNTFDRTEVESIVMEADKLDRKRGKDDGIDQAMTGGMTCDDDDTPTIEIARG